MPILRRMRGAGAVFVPAVALLFAAPAVRAAAEPGGTSAPPAAPLPATASEAAREADTPARFELRRGLRERDFALGYGFELGFGRFARRTGAPFVTAMPRYGRFLTSRRELLFELPVTLFTRPETALAGGASVLLRQHFAWRGRVIPFAEVGAGFVLTDLHVPELGGAFQFSLQGGGGFRFPTSGHSSLLVAARWYHLSNAGLRRPNTGLNEGLVLLSFSRAYR